VSPPEHRTSVAAGALRALRQVCFLLPPSALIGLVFPLDPEAMVRSLAQPCATWLPLAHAFGVAEERLLMLDLPTAACREIPRKLAPRPIE
jgi:hypothetical protein